MTPYTLHSYSGTPGFPDGQPVPDSLIRIVTGGEQR